jgi:hypothetical protein
MIYPYPSLSNVLELCIGVVAKFYHLDRECVLRRPCTACLLISALLFSRMEMRAMSCGEDEILDLYEECGSWFFFQTSHYM